MNRLPNGVPFALLSVLPISRSDLNPALPCVDTARSSSDSPAVGSFSGSALRPSRPIACAVQLYEAGVDPATANSSPLLRCPRHLHHSCTVCAAVKSLSSPSSMSVDRGTLNSYNPSVTHETMGMGFRGRENLCIATAAAAPAEGVESWKTGAGIGSGLAEPGVLGTVLRRRVVHPIDVQEQSHVLKSPRNIGWCTVGCRLSDLIPRFLRFSAFVAIKMGRKHGLCVKNANNSDHRAMTSMDNSRMLVPKDCQDSNARQSRENQNADDFSRAYFPTKEWYAILSGLLTRAVLEGYLSRGWKGYQGMECLLRVGQRPSTIGSFLLSRSGE